MRIQHNIMAMNAYRNYNNNTKALSGNLEKLSSGYKINRAGDDAAGLAISEKMRAQITGLDAAQKNVKDGISLVKTAEGAMQEIQDMLNRMDYLATQSANGTYDNEVDRAALQKEVEQLKSEINRIADSANFNGIKLLDGSQEVKTTPGDEVGVGMKDMAAAITHIADGVAADSPAIKTKFELDLSEVSVTNAGTELGGITQADTLTGDIADSADADKKTTITYDFTNSAIAAPAAGGSTVKLTIGDQELELDVGDAALTDAAIAGKVRDALAGKTVKIGGVDFTVATTTDETVKLEAAEEGNTSTTVGANGALTGSDITLTAGKPVQEKMQVAITLGDPNGTGATAPLVFDGIEVEYGKTLTGKDITAAIMSKLNDNKEVEIGGTKFKVSDNAGKLTFEMSEDPTTSFTADLTADLAVKDMAGNTTYAEASGTNNGKNDLGATINQGEGIGVHMIQSAKSAETRHLAQGSLDLTQLNNGRGIEDGTALKIGDETYVFAVGKDSKYKDMANVVDLTHVDPADTANWDKTAIAKEASRRLSAVAMGNKMFDVSTDNTTGGVRLTERLDSGIDYSVNNLQGPTADLLNELVTDTTKKNAAWKNLVQAGTANLDAKPAVTSGGLVLQIGDTSDDYNQLRVSIGDMHTKAMGIADIDISNQESAAAAIQTIKDGINYVSSIRGDLGAIQNRLEHTGNNLSVMAENIQDAESTIRDTDVADEMMKYVKNNILVQSAQAMLAQANQVPQGVLQLLG